MPFVCTLHDWMYTAYGNDSEIILKVLGVFPTSEEAIQYAHSYDFGNSNSEKWIEIIEFNGTENRRIGEVDTSGFSE